LLDNALKHSAGDIDISATRKGAEVEIRVHDHGPGIPPDTLEHVFDRFYRGEDSPLVPGFGLGLPIAKALTEGCDGTIAIESDLGTGSTIILRFFALNHNNLT